MGFTHHWRRPIELPTAEFAAAVEDVQRIIEATKVPVAGFEGTGTPVFKPDAVVFNGTRPRACEPFEISLVEFDRHGRDTVSSFCKTQHAPYDLCVRLALIVFEHYLRANGFTVNSDDDADDWAEARALCRQTCGYGDDFRLSRD